MCRPITTLKIDSKVTECLPLRILLAEDHAVNQKLARLMLQRLGYQVDAVANGLEVLAALRCQDYDVVLMDVQMPQMDGVTTTHHICQEWCMQKRPQIIAITANAMPGDREMCLQAGMDDYISKPIRLEELVRALSQCQDKLKVNRSNVEGGLQLENSNNNLQSSTLPYLAPTLAGDGNAYDEQPLTFNPCTGVIDAIAFQELREMLGDDKVLAEVIDFYLEDAPKLLKEIAISITQRKAVALERAAHTLKSSSAQLGAINLFQLCQKMEVGVQTGSLAEAVTMVSQVETELEKVQTALRKRRPTAYKL